MLLIFRCCFVILLVLSCGKVYAQGDRSVYNFANVGMTFLSVSTDARSGGMGELGVATLPDSYSHQQNASKYVFLDKEERGGVNIFYVPWLRHLVNDMSIAGASAYYRIGREQSVSASFRYFSMGDLHQTDENLQVLGERSPYEMAFDAAYARQLGKYFAMSVAFRFALSNIAQRYRKANVIAFDLSGYYNRPLRTERMASVVGIGFGLSNVGNKINYGPEDKLLLPAELKLGINLTAVYLKQHRFSIGVEGGKYLVSSKEDDRNNSVLGNIGAAFSAGEINRLFWKAGFEYGFHGIIFGRIGYFQEGKAGLQREYATFGAGIRFMKIHLDAAYLVSNSMNNHPLNNSFRVSAGVAF